MPTLIKKPPPIIRQILHIPNPYRDNQDLLALPLFKMGQHSLRFTDAETLQDFTAARLNSITTILVILLTPLLLFSDFGFILFMILTGAAVFGSMVLDGLNVRIGVDRLRLFAEPTARDLITLTKIDTKQTVRVLHTLGFIQAWRLMTWMLAFRAGLLGAVLLLVFYLAATNLYDDLIWETVLPIVILGALWLLYDTLWRTPVMVAVGIRRAAARHRGGRLIIMLIWGVLRVWLSYGLVLGAVLTVTLLRQMISSSWLTAALMVLFLLLHGMIMLNSVRGDLGTAKLLLGGELLTEQ